MMFSFDDLSQMSWAVPCLRSRRVIRDDKADRILEWRLADGKPFAVILRYSTWEKKDQPRETGEFLAVKGLFGFQSINADIDVHKEPKANAVARERADNGYQLEIKSRQSQ